MNLYTTTAMLAVLRSLRRGTPRFLLDTFFPGSTFSDDEQIMFDVEVDNMEVAPFVSPLHAGRVMSDTGYQTKMFKPAYVKPIHDIKPNEPIRRMLGEAIGGTMSAGQREQALLGQKLILQQDMILRRKEVMAAAALYDGQITVVGPDYPSTLVDFQRDAALKVELLTTDRWGEDGVSPYDDVEEWIGIVSAKSGAAVNIVVMTPDAWKLYSEDPKLDKRLDRTRGQNAVVDLGYKPGLPGTPIYQGRVGVVDFYTYNDSYTEGGVAKKLLADFTVLLGATGALEGTQAHGAILDPRAGYQPLEMFPTSWIENNPARRVLMTQSAPLVYPRRPNASMRVKVR